MTAKEITKPGRYRARRNVPGMTIDAVVTIARSFGRLVIQSDTGFGEIALSSVGDDVAFEEVVE